MVHPAEAACCQIVHCCVLQSLYDDLRAAYPAPQKPSGLTLVDTVGMADSKQSWWVAALLGT